MQFKAKYKINTTFKGNRILPQSFSQVQPKSKDSPIDKNINDHISDSLSNYSTYDFGMSPNTNIIVKKQSEDSSQNTKSFLVYQRFSETGNLTLSKKTISNSSTEKLNQYSINKKNIDGDSENKNFIGLQSVNKKCIKENISTLPFQFTLQQNTQVSSYITKNEPDKQQIALHNKQVKSYQSKLSAQRLELERKINSLKQEVNHLIQKVDRYQKQKTDWQQKQTQYLQDIRKMKQSQLRLNNLINQNYLEIQKQSQKLSLLTEESKKNHQTIKYLEQKQIQTHKTYQLSKNEQKRKYEQNISMLLSQKYKQINAITTLLQAERNKFNQEKQLMLGIIEKEVTNAVEAARQQERQWANLRLNNMSIQSEQKYSEFVNELTRLEYLLYEKDQQNGNLIQVINLREVQISELQNLIKNSQIIKRFEDQGYNLEMWKRTMVEDFNIIQLTNKLAQLSHQNSKIQQKQSKIRSYQMERHLYEKERSQKECTIINLQKKFQQSKVVILRLQAQKNILIKQLKQYDAQKQQNTVNFQRVKNELEKRTESFEQVQTVNEQLVNTLQLMNSNISKMQFQIDRLVENQKITHRLKQKNIEIQKRLDNNLKQNEQLKGQIIRITNQIEQNYTTIQAQQSTIQYLSNKLAQIKQEDLIDLEYQTGSKEIQNQFQNEYQNENQEIKLLIERVKQLETQQRQLQIKNNISQEFQTENKNQTNSLINQIVIFKSQLNHEQSMQQSMQPLNNDVITLNDELNRYSLASNVVSQFISGQSKDKVRFDAEDKIMMSPLKEDEQNLNEYQNEIQNIKIKNIERMQILLVEEQNCQLRLENQMLSSRIMEIKEQDDELNQIIISKIRDFQVKLQKSEKEKSKLQEQLQKLWEETRQDKQDKIMLNNQLEQLEYLCSSYEVMIGANSDEILNLQMKILNWKFKTSQSVTEYINEQVSQNIDNTLVNEEKQDQNGINIEQIIKEENNQNKSENNIIKNNQQAINQPNQKQITDMMEEIISKLIDQLEIKNQIVSQTANQLQIEKDPQRIIDQNEQQAIESKKDISNNSINFSQEIEEGQWQDDDILESDLNLEELVLQDLQHMQLGVDL